jgi:hypothetical protein
MVGLFLINLKCKDYMKKDITRIILEAVNIINENLENKLPVNQLNECPLYNSENALDSISLVSLISIVEDLLESKLGISVILASDKSMSMKNSPFLTIGTLSNYIMNLINQDGDLL